jgi:glycosyltransferase involved in cell wall biosynthesis
MLPGSGVEISSNGAGQTRRRNGWKKTFHHLYRQALSWITKWTAIPDIFVFLWGPFALYSGLQAIKREQVNIIYSTGPPFASHIVAALLKKMTKRPLVIDFRDAWTSDPVRRMKYPVARHPIESMLEKLVIQNADLVVATTEGISRDFRNRYGLGCEKKFMTLPNGFDREEFSLPDKAENGRPRKMRIVHTGFLRLERSPKPLLMSLRRLFDENPGMEDEFEVYLIGETKAFVDGRTIEDYLQELRLEQVVKLIGHVSQPEAIRYQMSADILLLVIGVVPPEEVSTYGIASKVFDYMVASRPVLALADPGPVRELVEKTQIGPAFAPSDIEGIKGYLLQALEEFREGRLEVKSNKAEIDRYDFRELTGQLVQQFYILTRHSTF